MMYVQKEEHMNVENCKPWTHFTWIRAYWYEGILACAGLLRYIYIQAGRQHDGRIVIVWILIVCLAGMPFAVAASDSWNQSIKQQLHFTQIGIHFTSQHFSPFWISECLHRRQQAGQKMIFVNPQISQVSGSNERRGPRSRWCPRSWRSSTELPTIWPQWGWSFSKGKARGFQIFNIFTQKAVLSNCCSPNTATMLHFGTFVWAGFCFHSHVMHMHCIKCRALLTVQSLGSTSPDPR